MLALEKIASSFISFPGFLWLIALILTIYLIKESDSLIMRILSLINVILMYILFTGVGTSFLVIPLENWYHESSFQVEQEAKYPIIILGGGIKYAEDNAYLSPFSLQRVVKGLKLYKKAKTPIVYTGGVAIGQEEISEAEVAAKWLMEMGVSPEDIVVEDRARTTYENGIYTKKWLVDYYSLNYALSKDVNLGDRKLNAFLVTNALHLPRSVLVFEKQGINVIPISSGISVDHKNSWLSYLPNRSALTANMMGIHEWLGLAWYKLIGRI